jgi:hypothetical protein
MVGPIQVYVEFLSQGKRLDSSQDFRRSLQQSTHDEIQWMRLEV